MDHLALHILRPNKNKSRFFGVDYFLSIASGHNPSFQYLSTPLDPNSVYKEGPISLHKDMYHFLEQELMTKEKGSIIGIFANPDIYKAIQSLDMIISLLEKYEMGLFIETSSDKILTDLNRLEQFSKNHPLLIAITINTGGSNSLLLNNQSEMEHLVKTVQKLRQAGLLAGFMAKPFIPYINDNVDDFIQFLNKAVDVDAAFVYPTFQINFDSLKIKECYNVIGLEFPELMIKLHEEYGFKTSWESKHVNELKKHFIIICRKNKVMYAMKDIIHSYKPDSNIQLKLF